MSEPRPMLDTISDSLRDVTVRIANLSADALGAVYPDIAQLEAIVRARMLARRVVESSAPAERSTTDEYVSIRGLARRIPYDEQTVRNMMSRGVFRLGVHYFKPQGRPIFKWTAVQAWLEGQS